MSDQTRIDWCDATINPWGWGCWGPKGTAEKPRWCSYCFAKRLANRKLSICSDCQAFIPHWHLEQLSKPYHWKKPRRIFVESMGDPFGSWIEPLSLRRVISVCTDCPQHTFYFLTKQPENIATMLADLRNQPLPNVWLGTTMTGADCIQRAPHMQKLVDYGWHLFVSIEPMLSFIPPAYIDWASWVIIGGLTGPGAKKHQPVREWVEILIDYCDRRGTPVFVKDSLQHVSNVQQWPNE